MQLVTDPSLSISVRYGPTGNTAVVGGQGASRPLSVDYVPPRTPVTKGELLVTSGLAHGLFPEGIPGGEDELVVRVERALLRRR